MSWHYARNDVCLLIEFTSVGRKSKEEVFLDSVIRAARTHLAWILDVFFSVTKYVRCVTMISLCLSGKRLAQIMRNFKVRAVRENTELYNFYGERLHVESEV